MKNIGFALFSVGIAISVIGGAKVPEPIELAEGTDQVVQTAGTWSNATPVFATGFVMALIGVILWRMGEASNSQISSENRSSSEERLSPLEHLYSLAIPFSQLIKNTDNLSLEELQIEVRRLLEHHLLPFVEQRRQVMSQLGMERGANLLIATAYCERMLNRVCSACADGHAQEAHASLHDAKESFNELMNLI